MPGWTLVETHPIQGRTFERALAPAELAFVLDARIKGSADSAQYFQLRLSNGSQDAHLFASANIIRAWLSTKRRLPLAGATIRRPKMEGEHSDLNDNLEPALQARFVVREHDLATVRPNEVIFEEIASAEEMQAKEVKILDGPRALSEDLQVQLRIYRETDPGRSHILHLVMLISHSISDLTSISTLTRCYLDTLARGGEPEPAQSPLEERLAMVVSPMELFPEKFRSYSMARRRWRMAITQVIYQLMMRKNMGGHTIPCRITTLTPVTPARSGYQSVTFTKAQTTAVLANCRLYKLTFGNAYIPLAQVAMTRVLYRRYLRGEISEKEWEYRKRQPYISIGPLSLRPRLDKDWFERGGGGDLAFSVSFFFHRLPFMTLGATEGRKRSGHLTDGAPPLSNLLAFDRFLYRAELVQKQADALFKHPLFFEIVEVAGIAHARRSCMGALQWMNHKNKGSREDEKIVSVTDLPIAVAHGGSSLGKVDITSPTKFPLPPTHPLSPYAPVPNPLRAGYINPPTHLPPVISAPKILVESRPTMLCTHPGELYLGASSSHGQLKMFVYHDRNVYEDGVIKEWLDEVKAAVLWYLGQTHHSCRAQRNGVEHGERCGCISAKL